MLTPITLISNQTFQSSGSGTLTLDTIDLTNKSLVITNTSDIIIQGSITGTGHLWKEKNGATTGGLLQLSGDNSYTGGTILFAGTIRATTPTALGATNGTVTIQSGGYSSPNAYATLELTNDIAIAQPISIYGVGTNTLGSQLKSSGGSNTVAGTVSIINPGIATNLTMVIDVEAGNLTFSNVISGPSGVKKIGAGQLTFAAQNTYNNLYYHSPPGDSLTLINQGTLSCNASNCIPTSVTVNPDGTLKFENTFTLNYPFIVSNSGGVIDGNGQTVTLERITGSGTLHLNGGTVRLSDGRFWGSITGTGVLEKFGVTTSTGYGALFLEGTNTYTGETRVSAGRLFISGYQPWSPVTIAGGVLCGINGTCGTVTGQSGQFGYEGLLHISGDLTLSSQCPFFVDFYSAYPGTYNLADVSGNVILNNTSLVLTNEGYFQAGTSFTLIKNNGGNAISGTFANLPEGSLIGSMGIDYLSYLGGSGSDVTVTQVKPATTVTAVSKTATTIQIQGSGVAGAQYRIQTSTNLIDWVWIGAVTAVSNGTFAITNPISSPQTFYRFQTP